MNWIDEIIDVLDDLLITSEDARRRRREQRRARRPQHERDMTWWQRTMHKLGWYP